MVSTSTDSVGNTYTQYNDGTYGKTNALGVYQGPAQSSDFVNAQQGQSLLTSLAQVQNGSFPLTSAQQGQLDGVHAAFQQLITNQQNANANLTGGTTVAMNLYGMGTSLSGLGEIKGTVDSGIAKVTDLNSQLVAAVSKMESGFQQDDLNAIKTAYDVYSNTVKSKQDELDKLQAAATAAIVEQKNSARADATQRLQAVMDDNTINYQQKQQELAQSTLDEKTKNDIAQISLERFKASLEQRRVNLEVRKENYAENKDAAAAASNSLLNNLPPVSIGAMGKPNPVEQSKFLASVIGGSNGLLAQQIKDLADYSQAPTDFTVRLGKASTQISRADMGSLAKKYDPSYNEAMYDTRKGVLKDFASGGKTANNILSLNTLIDHSSSLYDEYKALGNNSNTYNNATVNFAKSNLFGSGNAAAIQQHTSAYADELARALTGKAGTDYTIRDLHTLNTSSTPDQVTKVIGDAVKLLGGRLNEINGQYADPVVGMGKAPDQSFLRSSARTALGKLADNGVSTDIDGFVPPKVQQQAIVDYGKKNPNDQATILKMENDGATPDDIYNWIQQ